MYTKTQNVSFKKMRELLQDSYIENNEFMMQVNNETLKEFDLSILFKENDDNRKALISLITEECANNIWFFFREILPFNIQSYDDDNLYNLSEIPRFRLSLVSMIMIYLYSTGKNFAIQKCYMDSLVDTNMIRIAEQTLAMLSLYEYLFSSNSNSSLIYTTNQKGDDLYNFIERQYNTIMSITSKGLINRSDFICKELDVKKLDPNIKFFEVGLESEVFTFNNISETVDDRRNFYGIINHIMDLDDSLLKDIFDQTNIKEDKLSATKFIIRDFIANNFSFRYVVPEFINRKPQSIKQKYYLDRIFDNQGPLPQSNNIIHVI